MLNLSIKITIERLKLIFMKFQMAMFCAPYRTRWILSNSYTKSNDMVI